MIKLLNHLTSKGAMLNITSTQTRNFLVSQLYYHQQIHADTKPEEVIALSTQILWDNQINPFCVFDRDRGISEYQPDILIWDIVTNQLREAGVTPERITELLAEGKQVWDEGTTIDQMCGRRIDGA